MKITMTEITKKGVTFWFGGHPGVDGKLVQPSRDDARAFAKWARSLGVAAKAHYNFVDVKEG